METTRKKLLYISSNNGSDARINKELKSLSVKFDITFVGVGKSNNLCFGENYCKHFYLIDGKRNTPKTLLKQIVLVTRLIFSKFDSIHIINEQQMVFYYPLLFGQHVVLDLFDSIFLLKNKSKNKLYYIKRLVYAPVTKIIVTDQNRMDLMPKFTHSKIHILENYPNLFTGKIAQNSLEKPLTILYFGWLGKHRGTDFINKIIAVKKDVKVIAAGWVADEDSKILITHPQVEYRGILPQLEALQMAATEVDYIMCVYAPNSENNINASPNKIYDAIQIQKPVIINSEIRVSSFVKANNLGVVIDNYENVDIPSLLSELDQKRGSFSFDNELIQKYTWENIEHKLLQAHQV